MDFICPECGRRTTALYSTGDTVELACSCRVNREQADLAMEDQRKSALGVLERWHEKDRRDEVETLFVRLRKIATADEIADWIAAQEQQPVGVA